MLKASTAVAGMPAWNKEAWMALGQHPVVLEWEDSFSVGVDEIDRQHKKLIRLVNDLNRALKTGGGYNAAQDVIRELAAYALQHFQTEEGYMQRAEYPAYAEHKAEHEAFALKTLKFHDDLKQHNVLLSVEILFFLREWVKQHITTVDAKLKPYLGQLSSAAAPDSSEEG
jgi:hemerythrin